MSCKHCRQADPGGSLYHLGSQCPGLGWTLLVAYLKRWVSTSVLGRGAFQKIRIVLRLLEQKETVEKSLLQGFSVWVQGRSWRACDPLQIKCTLFGVCFRVFFWELINSSEVTSHQSSLTNLGFVELLVFPPSKGLCFNKAINPPNTHHQRERLTWGEVKPQARTKIALINGFREY